MCDMPGMMKAGSFLGPTIMADTRSRYKDIHGQTY